MLQRETLADAEPFAPAISLCRLARLDGWDYPDLTAQHWRCYSVLDAGGAVVHAGRTRALVPGQVLLIAPGTSFAARTTRPFRKLYVNFTWTSAAWRAQPGIHVSTLDEAYRPQLAKLAIDGLKTDGTTAPAALARLAWAIVGAALTRLPARALVAANAHPPEVRHALSLLHADPGHPPGNEALARAAGCHPGSLVRSFTASVGMPPQRYAMGLRLERAATLLTAGDEPIEAIAAACGFCDRNHFTRAFSRRWRCPPAEYRRRNHG